MKRILTLITFLLLPTLILGQTFEKTTITSWEEATDEEKVNYFAECLWNAILLTGFNENDPSYSPINYIENGITIYKSRLPSSANFTFEHLPLTADGKIDLCEKPSYEQFENGDKCGSQIVYETEHPISHSFYYNSITPLENGETNIGKASGGSARLDFKILNSNGIQEAEVIISWNDYNMGMILIRKNREDVIKRSGYMQKQIFNSVVIEYSSDVIESELKQLETIQDTIVKIEFITFWKNASHGLKITAKDDEAFSFCLDREAPGFGFSVFSLTGDQIFRHGEYLKRKLYLHASHPQDQGAIPLEFKGKDEARIHQILKSWKKLHPHYSEQIDLFLKDLHSERIRGKL